jgi:hypothetical protein
MMSSATGSTRRRWIAFSGMLTPKTDRRVGIVPILTALAAVTTPDDRKIAASCPGGPATGAAIVVRSRRTRTEG